MRSQSSHFQLSPLTFSLLSISRPPPRLLTQAAPCFSPNDLTPTANCIAKRYFLSPADLFQAALPATTLRRMSHTRILPYPADLIFRTIASVDQYPSFLPFATSAHVTSRDAHGWPSKATLRVGYDKFGLEENWASIVKCDEKAGVVTARSDNGPGANTTSLFDVLQTKWEITSGDTGGSDLAGTNARNKSSVRLDLEVKFRSPLYDQMFAQVEGKVAGTMMGAFERRVRELGEVGGSQT